MDIYIYIYLLVQSFFRKMFCCDPQKSNIWRTIPNTEYKQRNPKMKIYKGGDLQIISKPFELVLSNMSVVI